jgi:hypothetical protein
MTRQRLLQDDDLRRVLQLLGGFNRFEPDIQYCRGQSAMIPVYRSRFSQLVHAQRGGTRYRDSERWTRTHPEYAAM